MVNNSPETSPSQILALPDLCFQVELPTHSDILFHPCAGELFVITFHLFDQHSTSQRSVFAV